MAVDISKLTKKQLRDLSKKIDAREDRLRNEGMRDLRTRIKRWFTMNASGWRRSWGELHEREEGDLIQE